MSTGSGGCEGKGLSWEGTEEKVQIMLGTCGSGKVGQGKRASCWGMEGLEGVIAEKSVRARETNSGAAILQWENSTLRR